MAVAGGLAGGVVLALGGGMGGGLWNFTFVMFEYYCFFYAFFTTRISFLSRHPLLQSNTEG